MRPETDAPPRADTQGRGRKAKKGDSKSTTRRPARGGRWAPSTRAVYTNTDWHVAYLAALRTARALVSGHSQVDYRLAHGTPHE
jgi:hypothetical protein